MKFPISNARILTPSPRPAAPSHLRACDIRNPQSAIRYSPSAFTLTEILVAIALLLIIMVAVSTIFRTAGQTVGMGIAITDQNRALASASQQLQQDIVGYSDTDPYTQGSGLWPVNESTAGSAPPFLFIRNYAQPAQHDKDAGTSAFRVDSLGFFTRGAFKRQTGSNELVDQMPVFSKAYVWYGHLRLTGGGEMRPGYGTLATNPNNLYANQWILGRRAVLLSDVIQDASANPDATSNRGKVLDSWGNPVRFYGRAFSSVGDDTSLSPLSADAQSTLRDTGPLGSPEMSQSRYDIAAMNRSETWADYATLLQSFDNKYKSGTGGTYGTSWVERSFATRHLASPTENIDIDWNLSNDTANKGTFGDAAALSVPILLRNCTNFMVAFAGDYVDQNPANGRPKAGGNTAFVVTDPNTWRLDGVIDYDIVGGRQQIHWYGLGNTVAAMRGDVANGGSPVPMPFELFGNATTYSCGWTKDMLCLPATGTLPTPRPSLAPKLIRITVQVSDPQGRVLEDMTRQFVFPVKYN